MTDTQADLVARLRHPAMTMCPDCQIQPCLHEERTRADMNEAADEIERLRASNKQLREALTGARSQMHNLPRSLSADAAVSIIDAALKGDKT